MFPADYQTRMKELLKDEYDDYIRSLEERSYKALRLNPQKAEEAQLLVLLNTHIKTSGQVPWEPLGYYYDEISCSEPDRGTENEESSGDARHKKLLSPGRNPLHEAGMYYIQEPSAMRPVALMFEEDEEGFGYREAADGIKVLDLCAAPGGKSTQAAAYMQGRGVLVSNEIIPKRAKILSENIERMGVRNAVVLNETPGRLKEVFFDFFDMILVDAPCSGEGMFRKDENAVCEWSPDNVLMCAGRQDEILDCAASMLKTGGILVYSTCTFSKEEDEECIERFLNRHDEYRLLRQEKLFPHRVKGEGHFVAKLKRMEPAGSPDNNRTADRENRGYCRGGTYGGDDIREYLASDTGDAGSRRERQSFREFCMDTLTEDAIKGLEGRLKRFGDNLYLMPEGAPCIDGLKVMRPGLQLGIFKKDRFEPAHSWALALRPEEAAKTVNITLEAAASYIEGMTLDLNDIAEQAEDFREYGKTEPPEYDESIPGMKAADKKELRGWVLVCCEGISLGWGKAVGSVIKNHYPKGLRKKL